MSTEYLKKTDTHERKVALEGEDAFRKGAPLSANPYRDGSNDANLWALGWLAKNRKANNN